MIKLITHWYSESNGTRRNEMLQAVSANCDNPNIKECVVLDMSCGEYGALPFPTVEVSHRPTFTELVACGSEDANDVNVLINTDCYVHYDDTLLLERVQPGHVFCLSREDNKVQESQDCWAWRGRLAVDAPFHLGMLGCDNRFAFLCHEAGRSVLNPCKSIRVVHLHGSQVRHYDERGRVRGNYLGVEPCTL